MRGVIQHYEKSKIADAVDFDEALENFEVLYKKGLAKSTPSRLSNFRDVLEGDSKIETALGLSKLKGGTVVKSKSTHQSPPKRQQPGFGPLGFAPPRVAIPWLV